MFWFYFLLFAIFQIFLLIFLLEKRKKLNIRNYKLISFWIMVAGFIFLVVVGIYAPIKKKNSEPELILNYTVPSKFEDFNIKDVLEPIILELDANKDIYILDYSISLKSKNDSISVKSTDLFGSYKGKYYHFILDMRDEQYSLVRHNRIYENVYKDKGLLSLNEILDMDDIIDYEALTNVYSKIDTSNDISISFVYWPKRLELNQTIYNVNILDETGNFVFYEKTNITFNEAVVVDFNDYADHYQHYLMLG